MKCIRCGEEIPENGTFCEFCGMKLSDAENLNTMHEYDVPMQPAAPQQGTPKPKSKLLWVLIGVVALLVLAIGANMVIHNQKQKVRDDNAQVVSDSLKVMEEGRLKKMKIDYEEAIKKFDSKMEKLDKGQFKLSYVSVIDALNALQEIERIENKPSFSELGIKPCFKEKYISFRDSLITLSTSLSENDFNKKELEKCKKENKRNEYCDSLIDLLELIKTILRQTENRTSVADVVVEN